MGWDLSGGIVKCCCLFHTLYKSSEKLWISLLLPAAPPGQLSDSAVYWLACLPHYLASRFSEAHCFLGLPGCSIPRQQPLVPAVSFQTFKASFFFFHWQAPCPQQLSRAGGIRLTLTEEYNMSMINTASEIAACDFSANSSHLTPFLLNDNWDVIYIVLSCTRKWSLKRNILTPPVEPK